MYLSSQLAKLHPELTMPMFSGVLVSWFPRCSHDGCWGVSEITHRFQMARPELRQLLLQYLLPWLHNMELVDPNVPPVNPFCYIQYYTAEMSRPGSRREGWGSAEATEMVLNNLFYITAKGSRGVVKGSVDPLVKIGLLFEDKEENKRLRLSQPPFEDYIGRNYPHLHGGSVENHLRKTLKAPTEIQPSIFRHRQSSLLRE
uniref:Uncharacterized protein n=1 Tax=Timema poppense TaxID=170557 RepID=A0A7R9GYC6_TIMPO|nr:unnamed protein product [Timema poppensis]